MVVITIGMQGVVRVFIREAVRNLLEVVAMTIIGITILAHVFIIQVLMTVLNRSGVVEMVGIGIHTVVPVISLRV